MCDKQNINFPKCTEEFSKREKKKSLKTWNKRPSSSDHFPPAFFLILVSQSPLRTMLLFNSKGYSLKNSDKRGQK